MSGLRFSRYAGSKIHFVDRFNAITKGLDSKVYVEPFFGSGAVFFNLEKEYDLYVINDINRHVINALKSFRDGDYGMYIALRDEVFSKFGDIKKNKESYYNFRNWFNKEYFDSKKDPLSEGFYFHFLMNSCINSMVRIGPNGMNQSYGNRFFIMEEDDFNEVKRRLSANVKILSVDYSEILSEYNSDDALFFLDPPYFERNEVGYAETVDDMGNFESFITRIRGLSGNAVYTDIFNETQHVRLGRWHCEKTKDLRNISPNRRDESTNEEVCFTNFPVEKPAQQRTIALF